MKSAAVLISATLSAALMAAPTAMPSTQVGKAAAQKKAAPKKAAAGKAAAAPGKARVEVLTLQVGRPVPGTEAGGPGTMPVVYGVQGTSLVLYVDLPGRAIVGLDPKASKVESFTDDKKTDLMKEKAGGFMGGMPAISAQAGPRADTPGLSFNVSAPCRPAPGSLKVTLKGSVVVNCGSGEKTAEQKDLAIKNDSKITAGPVPMTIKMVQDGFGPNKLMVAIESKKPMDPIKSLAFTGPDGKAIKSEKMFSSPTGFGADAGVMTQYGLAEKVDKATLKVTYYQKVDPVPVPFEIATGVGF